MHVLKFVWIALALWWLVLAFVLIMQRRKAGAVLLDAGPSPRRHLMLACAALLTLFGVMEMVQFPGEQTARDMAYLTWAAYMIIGSTGRVQIREAGVSNGLSIVPWSRVISVTWPSAHTAVLVVDRWAGQRTFELRLRGEQVAEARQILSSRIPEQAAQS